LTEEVSDRVAMRVCANDAIEVRLEDRLKDAAVVRPARFWPTAEERVSDAERAPVNAARALTTGVRLVATEFEIPAMLWETAGARETEADNEPMKAARDASEAARAREAESAMPEMP
jgi:hypothetical protein